MPGTAARTGSYNVGKLAQHRGGRVMPFIDVRDLQVYYERQGTGPRLLFISGTGGDLRRRPSVFERPIAEHFEILSYDQRGLGQTSKPAADYTMADYAEDAVALLDAVGWDRCHVMGVSF